MRFVRRVLAAPSLLGLVPSLVPSLVLSLAACSSSDTDADSLVASATPTRPRPAGTLSWQPCGNIECSTLEVPIDYGDPSAGTLSLALNRARANGALGYRGAVLVNPGGPGASGKVFTAAFAPLLRTQFPGYDFIGFDPRGIAESSPLGCEISSDVGTALLEDGAAGFLSAMQLESRRCAQQAGALFDNMGSNQVVADIDGIREALGEEEINFFGISYGTRLGELYAFTYPERARAVILDAPMSPIVDSRQMTESQFSALLELQQSFFDDCDAGVLECPANPERVFQDWIEAGAADGTELARADVWRGLLVTTLGRVRGALILRVQAGEVQPAVPSGQPSTEQLLPTSGVDAAASLSVTCADEDLPPLSAAAAQQLLDSFERRSEVFRLGGLPALSCSAWGVRRDPVPTLEFEPRVPPLVIGGTRDILTPYPLAEETVQLIEGAALLTSEHYGHAAFVNGLQGCVFGHLRRYLDTLELPPAGARCEPPPAP